MHARMHFRQYKIKIQKDTVYSLLCA